MMEQARCYDCDVTLTDENGSEEHIIPNSIGGRLKSKRLLCIGCNSDAGSGPDAVLAKQLNSFANFLDVNRDRGEPRKIRAKTTDTNEEVLINPGGKPEFVKPIINVTKKDENTEVIEIKAPNLKMARQALEGLKRKYKDKQFPDIEQFLEKAKAVRSEQAPTVTFQIGLGGNEFFRAVTKIAVNFYLYSGGVRASVSHLLPYIRGECEANTVWLFYPDQDVFQVNERQVIHAVAVKGDSKARLLYALIDLFSANKYLVILNENYDGPDVLFAYGYDLLSSTQIEAGADPRFNRDDLLSVIRDQPRPYDAIKRHISRFGEIAMDRQWVNHKASELTSAIYPKVFGKYPPGTELTDEQKADLAAEFASEVVKGLMPNILAAAQRNAEEALGEEQETDPADDKDPQ